MTFKTWLLFLVMETALSLSPGPAVFYVVSQGVRGALRRTLPAAAGILTANGIYFALSATSLGAIIAASARFFTIAKWVGAAYLIYLGIKALRSANSMHAVPLGGAHPAVGKSQSAAVLSGAAAAVHRPGNCGGTADVDFGRDVDGAGILYLDRLRLACAPCRARDGEIRRYRQYEPVARADRGDRAVRLRDTGLEVQPRHLTA